MTWTVQKNDVVGGWMVTNFAFPLSMHTGNYNSKCYTIAECANFEDAATIATLLNAAKIVRKAINE